MVQMSSQVLALIVLFCSCAQAEEGHFLLPNPKQYLFGGGKIEFLPSTIAVAAIPIGLVICFYGYRLFKWTLLLAAFALGSIAFYTVVNDFTLQFDWSPYASWFAFAVGGILGILFVKSLYKFGLFGIGAAGGVLFVVFLNNTFAHEIIIEHEEVLFWILCIIVGIIGGILALMLEKPVFITATSFSGAVAAVWGVGYFVGNYPNATDIQTMPESLNHLPIEWYIYTLSTVVLFLAGICCQFQYTGSEYDHEGSFGERQNLIKSRRAEVAVTLV